MFGKKAFTLIELLVSISLLMVVSVVVVSIFIFSVRSVEKTETVKKIKQRGEKVLSVIERSVRNGERIENCSDTSFDVVDRNNQTTSFICEENQIASNSAILVENYEVDCANFVNCSLVDTGVSQVQIRFTLSSGQTSTEFKKNIVPRNNK